MFKPLPILFQNAVIAEEFCNIDGPVIVFIELAEKIAEIRQTSDLAPIHAARRQARFELGKR